MKNVMLYLLHGSVIVNDVEINSERNAVTFMNDGSLINIKAGAESKLLLLAGNPIHEPVAQYGPFVMNTHEELNQAFDDYYNGKMGTLE
jgi:redox-sensitive bicupin YhaK (pirin superfamily)